MSDETASLLADLSDAEFRRLTTLVYEQFGIHLTDKKKPLVRGRLHKVLQARGLTSFSQYLEVVQADASGVALIELIDRLSTNHTFFFREAEHFDFFQQTVLPELRDQPEIRLWCAGCATGEEAYTLAMLADAWQHLTGYAGALKILATDISLTALQHAQVGEYTTDRIRLVPTELQRKYFTNAGADAWRVSDTLKAKILFKRLNFMDPTFPFRQRFHAVFCRNVMIYFDKETKNDLVRRLTQVLEPQRYLFIGHSETLGRDTDQLTYVRPSVYRRRP